MESKSRRSISRKRIHLDFPGPFPALSQPGRKSISPGQVQDSLRLSRAENLWRYMHASTHREPAINHSKSMLFPQATSNSVLSSMTQRANQKLEGKPNSEEGLFSSASSARFLRTIAGRFPSESDFKRVIEKLNRVYAQGGVDSLKTALAEGKSHEFLLDADDWMYARVSVHGQFCPVVITISRSRGRLATYTSKSIQEPQEMLCDSKFTGDRIWVSDPGVRFHTKTLFISIHAFEDTTFTLHVQFGQKKRATKERWKSMSDGMFGKDDEWSKLFGNYTERKPKVLKDFISMNRVKQARESPDRTMYFTERSSLTDLRRKEVLQRWQINLKQKKQRALEVLNRQELREIARQKELEIAREKAAVLATERKWLGLVWGVKSFDHFLDKFLRRKEEIKVEKVKAEALMKLQRAFRRYTNGCDSKKLSLRRCSQSLQFAVRSLCEIEGFSICKTLMSCIRISAKNARMPIKFAAFYRKSKSHSVLFLQYFWRECTKRDKRMFEQLQAAWNSALAAAISAASKKKQAVVKGKKSKENPSSRYLNITSLVKNRVLSAHFRSAKEQLAEDVRAYLLDRKSGEGIAHRPEFKPVPISEDMMKLVEKAAETTLQSAETS